MDPASTNRMLLSLKENATKRPSEIAMYDETSKPTRSISFRLLYEQVERTSFFLRAHSFRSGDKAAAMLSNAIEFPIIHLGIWSCRGTIVGSSTFLSADELRYQWIDSETTMVFTTQAYIDVVTSAARGCPSIRLIVCVGHSPDCEIHFEIVEETKENSHANSDKLTHDSSIDSSLSIIYYTSGTTGPQKGVKHTHRSLLAGVEIYERFILNEAHPAAGISPEDSLKEHQILTTPFFHLMGFLYLNVCILTGLPAVVHFTADPEELLRMVAEYRPQFLLTYPLMVQHLSRNAVADMGSLKVIVSSGSRLRKEIVEDFIRRFPTVQYLTQGFGMTEVGFTHLPLLQEQSSVDSVGVPVKEYEQMIMGINIPRECLTGELGELCVRGPAVTAGYLNKEKETRELIDEDGWVHTGDIGYVNEQRELFLVDRMKEIISINYKGTVQMIFPSLIERVLLNCRRVADAAVAGCSDGRGNEYIRAFVVKGDPLLNDEDVLELVTESCPNFMHLTGGVHFLEAIPRSGGGKILRRFLPNDAKVIANEAA